MAKHEGKGEAKGSGKRAKHSTTSDHPHVNPRDNDARKANLIVRLAEAANQKAMDAIRAKRAKGQ